MKRFFFILILTFFFQFQIKADDIRDFQIEGMGIGESLLDYVDQKKIKKSFYPKSKKYVRSWHNNLINSSDYSGFQFHYKPNDKNFIIHGIDGHILYETNINNCYKEMIKVKKEIDNVFTTSGKKDEGSKR